MLLDLMHFSTTKLKAVRRLECRAPACARVQAPVPDETGLEIDLQSLAEAAALGLEVIDIREAGEIAATPLAARHVAMAALLADASVLSPGARYLLVCASGRRSLAAARELRKRGLSVRSLAGGLVRLAR
jgi:rhodanese-related sulfurtransferase